MIEHEFKNVCQLLTTNKTNATLALQLIKKQPELKERVNVYFQPLLDILGKKTLRSISTVVEKINSNKCTSIELLNLLQWENCQILFKNLSKITIERVDISHLPQNIGKLSPLKELFIHTTLIEQLPDSIGQLKNLTELSLRHNQLKQLPDSIGQLSQLKTLRLYSNQLRELPDSIGNLTQLETLILSDNKIQTFPNSIKDLSNLKSLHLDNTDISSLPKNIKLEKVETIYVKNSPIAKDTALIKKAFPNIKEIWV